MRSISTDKSHYQKFEPPFLLPDSWEWATVRDVSSSILYGVSESAKPNGKYKLLRITDIQDSNVIWDNVPFTNFDTNKVEQYILQNGDILFARTGATVGKSYLVREVPLNSIYASYLIRIRTSNEICPKYLKLFFETGCYWQQISEGSVGIGQPNVNGTSLGQLLLPVPPKAEQIRIINRAESLTELISSIDVWTVKLSRSIEQTKNKILDLAIQGKLVPQNPTDEPAADMLLRINPKAKIITYNPQCQNLPSGWTLCELRDLCIFLSRGKSPKYSEMQNQYPVFAQKCNLKDGGISLALARFLDESTLDKWPSKYHLLDGDILINSTGTGTVGRTRIFDNSCMGHYTFVVPDSHVSVARIFEDINSKYIFYCLYSKECQRYFEENLAGSTNQKELYIDIIGDRKIMLPPLKEQRRIVRKIEELYKVLNSIETSLQS